MGLFLSLLSYAGIFILAHELPIANYLGLMVCCVVLNIAYVIRG